MAIKLSAIKGLEIIYQKEQKGVLKEVFIENATGKIAGILNNKKEFFIAKQICCLKNNQIILNDDANIDAFGKNWLGMQTETRSQKKMGKVMDLYFDDNFVTLLSIEVKKRSYWVFFSKKIITIDLIFDVQDKKIIIIDDVQETPEIVLTPEISI